MIEELRTGNYLFKGLYKTLLLSLGFFNYLSWVYWIVECFLHRGDIIVINYISFALFSAITSIILFDIGLNIKLYDSLEEKEWNVQYVRE